MTEPIKLLDFYGKDDRDCFFGRDDERIELGRLIESYPAVILTGESGIGKTSLLLAGVIPDITRDIIYHRINPGSRGLLKEKVFPLLNQAPGAAAGEKKLIVLDQFEELLLEREFGGDWFPASLIEPLFSSGSCTLLFSLRSDYLPLFMKWLKSLRAYFRAEQFMYLERLDRRRGADILARIMSYYREAVDYPLINSITGELAKLDAGGGIYPPHVQIVAAHLIKRGLREGDPVDAALVETMLSQFFDREIFQGFSEYDQKLIKDLLDMLVGRAGLRRKFTLEELGSRLNETEERLTSLCTALIDRRVLRRTEEGRIEIIHDFLSRYFFDSLSGNERKKRRYQDMFFSAFLDFSESGILLDEKRARMLLHHLEWIHLRREEKIFFLKSLMSLFAFGDTFYLNLAMTEDILDMVAAEQDSENRHSMLSRSRTLFSTGEAGRLKELYEREDVPRVKGLLLSIVSPLDPGWAAGEIGGRIRDWEILSETMLEEMLQTAKEFPVPGTVFSLGEVLARHPTELIRQLAADALLAIESDEAAEAVLSAWEEGRLQPVRLLDNIVNELQRLVRDRERFIRLLKRALAGKDAESAPNLYAVYIMTALPGAAELEELMKAVENAGTLEVVVVALGDTENPLYVPALVNLEKKNRDSYVLSAMYRALGSLKCRESAEFLAASYETCGSPSLKSEILRSLIQLEHPSVSDLCRPLLRTGEQGSHLFISALAGTGRRGDESDLAVLRKLFAEAKDASGRLEVLDAVSQILERNPGRAAQVYGELWLGEMDTEIRLSLGCNMMKSGLDISFSFLADRIAGIDEQFEGKSDSFSFRTQGEPVMQILFTLLKAPGPADAYLIFRKELADLVRYSANRVVAALGIITYTVLFGGDEETRRWLLTLAETARGPEMRGCAAAALTRFPSEESFSCIKAMAGASPWPDSRRLALYGLGTYPCSEKENNTRLKILSGIAKEDPDPQIRKYADWVLAACRTEDGTGKPAAVLPEIAGMFSNPLMGWLRPFGVFPML